MDPSQDLLRGLLAAGPDALVAVDAAGAIVFANDQAEQLFGWSQTELLGATIELLVPERFAGGHPALRRSYLAAPTTRPMGAGLRLWARRKDGSEFPAEVSLSAFDTGDGPRVAAAIRDTSQARRSTAPVRTDEAGPDFRALFESAPAAFLVLDTELVIQAVTDAYLAATMTRRAEIVGRPLFDVFPDNPSDATADGVGNLHASLDQVLRHRVADTMAVQKYDIRRPRSEGGGFEVRYWSPVNSPVFDAEGRLVAIIHQVMDVTEFVALQDRGARHELVTEELRERGAAMEAEVMQRSRELQLSNRRLRAANDARSDLLSRVSHELRTPLNAILGFGQLLELDRLGSEHRESVHQIMRAGEHLLGLIDGVLDITRMDRGQLRLSLEPTSVRTVVDETVGMIRPLAERRRITVVIEPMSAAAHVLADHQRLKQVMLNLLANAVKYNRDGGEVHIGCELLDFRRLRVTVTDTGPGIAGGDLGRLFQPFERLAAEQSHVEGTGLGLALSKQLVTAMGGEIGVHSEAGEGSTFWVDLPTSDAPSLDRVPEAATSLDLPVSSAARTRTVLYVEDNLSNVTLLERLVARRPHVTLLVAMQGSMAQEMALEHRPDVILLDLHLPDISGEEVLERLKADPRTAATPVVVLSADATSGQPRRLLAKGAADYLTKPFDLARLLTVIEDTPGGTARPETPRLPDAPVGGEGNGLRAPSPLATFVHDLNNQLGIIGNFAALLAQDLSDADAVADLEKIQVAAERAVELARSLRAGTADL